MRWVRALLRAAWRLAVVGLLAWGGWWLMAAPGTPLPDAWNPLRPLSLADPATPLTRLKLGRALASPEACRAALATGAAFAPMDPFEGPGACGIPQRVRLSAVGGAALPPVETACPTALRLALWERHVLRDAARDAFGAPAAGLRHQGSYNCRAVRGGTRPSSHSTAAAIDIRAVALADGREVPLLGNWAGEGPEARFWRAARDGACDWFVTVLGPEFDAGHADHLHLQATGWGTCR